MPTLTISKKTLRSGRMVILRKEYQKLVSDNEELRQALRVVVEGERTLREGKTRTFREFLKTEFPEYAENQ